MKGFQSLDSPNSKKAVRAVNSTSGSSQARVCKQCGKGFQSLKALCGHMACHSEKGRVLRDKSYLTSENSERVDDHSDSEENLIRQTRSETKRYKKTVKTFDIGNNNNGSLSVCDIEEKETEDVAVCLMMLSRDSRNWGGVNSIVKSSDNHSGFLKTKSSFIEMKTRRNDDIYLADEILDMKKFGDWKTKSTESVHFENACSEYLKKEESEISTDELLNNGEYKDAELAMIYNRVKHYRTEESKGLNVKNEFGDVGISPKLLKFNSKKRGRDCYDSVEPSKNAHSRKKYNCVNCNKSFNSFQALGGHRPCHKKTNATFHLEYDSDDNSLDGDDIALNSTPIRKLGERYDYKKPASRYFPVDAKKKTRPKKTKGYQCPFCPKMFKSGQALGGHKRTHFINAPIEVHHPTSEIKQDAVAEEALTSHNLQETTTSRNLIDLNLPAPEQDDEFDDHNQFICLD